MKLFSFLALALVMIVVIGSTALAASWSVADFEPGVPIWVEEMGRYEWRNLDGTFSDDFDYSLFGENFINLIRGIEFNLSTDKWMDDFEKVYMSEGWTTEEICVAVYAALQNVRNEDNAWVTEGAFNSYERYLFKNGFGSGTYQSNGEKDLGDESVPLSVLYVLAAVAFGGAVYAHRRRCSIN